MGNNLMVLTSYFVQVNKSWVFFPIETINSRSKLDHPILMVELCNCIVCILPESVC